MNGDGQPLYLANGVPSAADVVLAMQDAEGLGAVENLQSLYPLKEQLHATLKHVEGLVACAAQERDVDHVKLGDSN